MNRPTLIAFAVGFAVSLAVADTADAAWRWRRARAARAAPTNTYQAYQRSNRTSTNSLRYYSGVSRAEYDYWRRRDAWSNHAYNGFRPEDFR